MIVLMLISGGQLPNWVRWLTLAAGVLATGAPFSFRPLQFPSGASSSGSG